MKLASFIRTIKLLFGTATLANLLVVSLLMFSTSASAANTFRNPLNTDHGSDPWMTYYNGQYYLTATTWSTDPNVGVTMKHASTIAGLITATPQRIFFDTTSSRCCNIWAPEFHLLNGPNGQRWYLYYVAGVAANTDSQRMYVAESAGTDPLGPYTFKGQLAVGGPTDAWAVDPTIMQINGQLYLFYSAYEGAHYSTSQNIYGVALSNPWTVSGSPALISRPTFSWETGTAAVNEGPVQLTAPNGTIYLVFSATWCGNPNYQLGRATYNGGPVLSQSSWVKFNGAIFTHANGQYSTAHNGFFKSPDGTEDWIVYHGVTNSGGACDNSRTTRIQKFTWNADNTPNLGAPLALTSDIAVPSGEGGVSSPTSTPTRTPTTGPSPTPTISPTPGSGPLHWYKFDGNANDSGSNVQNGTLFNSPGFVTGKNGQAVNLNGSSRYVSLPAGIVNGLNDFTIATWVNAATIATWSRIFDFGTGTTVNMFLTPTSGSTIRFAITTGGSGAEQRINGAAALTTGWHHVAVTLSGSTGRLYVDGVQVGQNTAMTLKPSSLGNTTQNWIGRSEYSGDPYINAQIDQFRIYNRALSAAEILALFQTP